MPATVETLPGEDVRTQRPPPQPPYAVILHNDDLNTMEFVVAVLRRVFAYNTEKCASLMMEAHEKGRAVVWVGSREVAEFKSDQVQNCGADPARARAGAEPLQVTIEPAA